MLTRTCKRIGLVALTLSMALGLGACATGYIVSSVQSVIGLDVSENPQTQVPHIRFGFVRSQYYYIPTGKSESKGGPSSGKADEVPPMVSSFDVDLAFLQTVTIREKFAVGAAAVQTDAAKLLFNPQYTPVPTPTKTRTEMIQQIVAITKGKPDLKKKGKDWIDKTYPAYKDKDFTDFANEAPEAAVQKLVQYLQTTAITPQ